MYFDSSNFGMLNFSNMRKLFLLDLSNRPLFDYYFTDY